ncbi:uncharacterized protein [Periplaneta americana]|uniref:uncharacterized protein n=1 Tax=Periplaneta americana TaxID=6978 RepID=UPI0037E93FA8
MKLFKAKHYFMQETSRLSLLMHERYQERIIQKVAALKEAMKTAERAMWRCDPRQHSEGETYIEVTRLLQGHIQNEVDMNSEHSCRESCADYSYARTHGCNEDRFCPYQQQRCNGKLRNCRFIDSDMWVCEEMSLCFTIQEAGLLPRGGINMTSVQWKPVDDYRISDSNVSDGKDYHTLRWRERAIDLDDLVAPEGYVLTGVRFRLLRTHLNLEIMVTPLNFSAGTLYNLDQESKWYRNNNTPDPLDEPRTQLYFPDPDVPTLTKVGSVIDSRSNQFLLFTHSDIDNDAAQTTVPFLDSQPVAPEPPTLLAGAGIYHKGCPGYGGFIGLKVVTYDFNSHLNIDTEDQIN